MALADSFSSQQLVSRMQLRRWKWLTFQFCSLACATFFLIIVIPTFVAWLKPQRVAEQDVKRYAFLAPNNQTFRDLLPPNGSADDTSAMAQAQMAFWKLVLSENFTVDGSDEDTDPTFFWKVGMLDLTLAAKNMDPNALKIDMALSGHPYGYLSSETNQDVLYLITRSVASDYPLKSLMSCHDPGKGNPTCADVDILVGKSEVTFKTGDTIGYNMLTTDVKTDDGLDMFPFDTYTVKGVVRAEVTAVLPHLLSDIYAAVEDEETSPTRGLDSNQTTVRDSVTMSEVWTYNVPLAFRLEFLPAMSGWSMLSAELRNTNLNVTVANFNPKTKRYDLSFAPDPVLEYEVVYQRSMFVKLFTVLVLVLMWIMSIYLLVLSVDHIFFRPRSLNPATVGYAVGMLFALPTLRLLLAAPLGSYIDFWGFMWNMVLVAVAVIIFLSGAYQDHDHKSSVFAKDEEPVEVKIVNVLEGGSSSEHSDNMASLLKLMAAATGKHGASDAPAAADEERGDVDVAPRNKG